MQRRWLVIAVILTVAPGCDNVTWGGIDVRLQGPPSADSTAPAPIPVVVTDPGTPVMDLPTGPILLAGARSGARATLIVVGEVRSDAVVDFPSDDDTPGYRDRFTSRLLGPGSEFILFSEGVRVGRLVADESGVNESFCIPRPTVSGTLELVPSATNATQFLALPAGRAAQRGYEAHRPLDHTYEQRVASNRLAREVIPRVGAQWPPSVLEIRADMQAFQFQEAASPTIAASFLHQDQLRVGAAPDAAYSIFFLGELAGDEYQTSYVWYRPASDEGKGAPRFFDHLDLDGDGTAEVLLDVFGADSRWFAGLARRNGAWTTVFQDSCGQPNPAP
jgi:hypothetical protein